MRYSAAARTHVENSVADDQRTSDADLLALAGRGDARAFEALYHRYRDFVHRVTWRFCRDEHEALDVMQDVFAGLLRQAPRLRLTGRLSTYLYPAVRNAVATRRRKDRPLRFGEAPDAVEEVRGAPAELPAVLARALDGLNPPHREVLLMRVIDGMSMEEMAVALDVPVGTVKSRLHHAVQSLRGDEGLREFWV